MIGLPHMRTADAKGEDCSPNAPDTPSSTLIMEVREGRVGNAFACERCRKHKVRCVPSDTASVCQRCQKARVECIEHVARRRQTKMRSDGQTPTKMHEFDKKLDKLSSIIVATMGPSPPQSALPPIATVSSHLIDAQLQTPAPLLAPTLPVPTAPILDTQVLQTPGSKSDDSVPFWESLNDTLSCLGRLDPVIRSISVAHIQTLLNTYRTMVDFFPFVPLPRNSLCCDLLQQRPLLMLAVLTVASYESIPFQLKLSREFRKVLMVKIMNGEKNLDLLQGLLVFIAWHHHYMDVQAISIPMLLQLCVGIASDLGLDTLAMSAKSPLHSIDNGNREAKRTYLGCYYLVSNIGLMDSCKTRSILHSTTLRNYTLELASAWESKSDAVIPTLIDVCQFMEDVEETFHNQAEQVLVARSQVKRLTEKWEDIRHASKAQTEGSRTLHWLQLAAHIRLYRTAASVELADRESSPSASGFQLSLRLSCLRAIEKFLDNSTKLSTGQYGLIGLVDWLNLVSAITSLSKLALHTSPMSGWDPLELQIAKTFEYFGDLLSSQMPRSRNAQESSNDVFQRFRRTTTIMKQAVRNTLGRTSPNGSTFELATGSGRTVSLLQDVPLPKPNGSVQNAEKLPSLWQVHPSFDISSSDFHWKFLMGAI